MFGLPDRPRLEPRREQARDRARLPVIAKGRVSEVATDSTDMQVESSDVQTMSTVTETDAELVAPAADQAPVRAQLFERGYDTTRKMVTLTFDSDWWSPGDVETVLRILRENGIIAGFALTGRYAERYPDQTRAVMAAGHKLINHSYDHPDFCTLTPVQRCEQLRRAEEAFARVGGTSDGWFRAPYRACYATDSVNIDLASCGYYINFDWTYDTLGYQSVPPAQILERVRTRTVPGTIILMHLGDESTDTAALPSIISTLREMGYGFTDPCRAVTRGTIGAKYALLGAQRSVLGVPRTGEMVATTAGTAVQWFAAGRIYWRSDLGEAFEVHGGILGKYRELGTVTSFLQFPTTDERLTPDGIGRYNHFQGQGGSIYWSPSSGAHEVHGAIRAKWAALGWERGFLRYPISDEVAVTGGRGSQFQGGNVYWSGPTGAHEVHGAILGRYLQLGGTGSRLGLPVSDEYPTSTGARNDFQHGSISWNRSTGATTVIYQ